MAEAKRAALEPTFDLPTGGQSDFYLSREVINSDSEDNGKIIKKEGLWDYPFLTRRTGDSLVGTNEEITSSELRHGRTAGKTKIGTASSSGSHDFEFSPETFDDQLEGTFESKWVRWTHDGAKDLVTKDYLTPEGYIHVRGDNGTYNQKMDPDGKGVSKVPLFFTKEEAGEGSDPFGIIEVSKENYGYKTRAEAELAGKPLGKFVVHELHVGEEPVKYTFTSKIPINGDTVRYQSYRHVQIGEMNLNVTVNSIVTGSFTMQGSNNPPYLTQVAEAGKVRAADRMGEEKDMAIASEGQSYSDDYVDAAERFLKAVQDTTKSTETDQFTALEGFLFINGHQLQFASDLTMDINKNIQPINAIFVKNAIANIEPKLDITGNITTYFTDGEMDDTGMKFGADDLKNLASENKDVEIVYAFQDKEDPQTLYLFQIFKATFASPSESKDAESPITLDLSYTSYGEMAVRCLRIALPKVRKIKFDVESVMKAVDGTDTVNVTLVPNVPFTKEETDRYFEEGNEDYIFKGAEVYVNAEEDTEAILSGLKLNDDGSINATITLSEPVFPPKEDVEGELKIDNVQLKVRLNGEDCEGSADIVPEIPYVRMGKNFCDEMYKENVISVEKGGTLDVLAKKLDGSSKDEDYLFFAYDRASNAPNAKDYDFKSSDIDIATVEDGVVTAVAAGKVKITVTSKYDPSVHFSFNIEVTEPVVP